MNSVEITPEPGPWPGESYKNCWPVEGRVRGSVRLVAAESIRTRRVHAELEWHTEGRGDRNRQAAASCDLHTGDIPAGEHTWGFDFAVPPEGPISYDGHLLQILWVVRVTIDIPWGRDHKEEYPITILPDYDTA